MDWIFRAGPARRGLGPFGRRRPTKTCRAFAALSCLRLEDLVHVSNTSCTIDLERNTFYRASENAVYNAPFPTRKQMPRTLPRHIVPPPGTGAAAARRSTRSTLGRSRRPHGSRGSAPPHAAQHATVQSTDQVRGDVIIDRMIPCRTRQSSRHLEPRSDPVVGGDAPLDHGPRGHAHRRSPSSRPAHNAVGARRDWTPTAPRWDAKRPASRSIGVRSKSARAGTERYHDQIR